MTYMIQLDGLRCLAVMLVMWAHFGRLPGPYDYLGVLLFFVISGFLITTILLETGSLKSFYARRLLRIFPAYYAVLGVAILAGDESAVKGAWWFATYLGNFYMSFADDAPLGGRAAHFWSLAVEEQFYVVWPFIVLFAGRRMLAWSIGAMIVTAPLFRLAMMYFGFRHNALLYTPFCCMDSLGAGAALAYMRYYRVQVRWLWIGVPALLVALHLDGYFRGAFLSTGGALGSLWLVHRATLGFTGHVGALLEWGPVVHIGKISYGLYLVHNFFREMSFWDAMFWSFACAWVLWFVVEQPINGLKRFFPYRGRQRPRAGDEVLEPIVLPASPELRVRT